MKSNHQISLGQKVEIISFYKNNVSKREIARKVKRSHTAINKIIKKYEENGSILRKKGSARPRITSARDESHIKRLCLQNRYAAATQIHVEIAKSQIKPCSVRTVQRRLNEMGLKSRSPAKKPLLSKEMKSRRLAWCRTHENWTENDWSKVIFSDESKFNLIGPDGTLKVRRRKGERYNEECTLSTVKHSPYVMAWGCITFYGVGNIKLLEGSVDGAKYIDIINDGVVPTIEQLFSEVNSVLFQDDSAPCHRAKIVDKHKKKLGISSLSWPGNSPDLNPIENLWYVMGKKIREKKPSTIKMLRKVIEDVWENCISHEYLQELYRSMPRRVEAVIKAKGGPIPY